MIPTAPNTVETLQDGLRRIIASNPSPMTYWGTNTYIVGHNSVVVIDPGPADPAHMKAILGALKPGETISHILVTHSHLDHSPLAAPLANATGAPVYAFGNSNAGRSDIMTKLAKTGLMGGGEGVDHEFAPDELLADGDTIVGDGWKITALWTPGHLGNHLCFVWGNSIFTGDHIMGWASSLVSPPDGDLTDFMASTRKLAKLSPKLYYPAHGAPVLDPAARIKWLLDHRLNRESAIISALSRGEADVISLAKLIYSDTAKTLITASGRTKRAGPFGRPGSEK